MNLNLNKPEMECLYEIIKDRKSYYKSKSNFWQEQIGIERLKTANPEILKNLQKNEACNTHIYNLCHNLECKIKGALKHGKV